MGRSNKMIPLHHKKQLKQHDPFMKAMKGCTVCCHLSFTLCTLVRPQSCDSVLSHAGDACGGLDRFQGME